MSRKAALDWSLQSFLHRRDFHQHCFSSQPAKRRKRQCIPSLLSRQYSSPATTPYHNGNGKRNGSGTVNNTNQSDACSGMGNKAKEKLEDREFFTSLLSSASTKREAKAYLSRFKNGSSDSQSSNSQFSKNASGQRSHKHDITSDRTSGLDLSNPGVNLGNKFQTTRAADDSPRFRPILSLNEDMSIAPEEELHVALVKLKDPQLLDDETLGGVARTLSQLNRLGMGCCVVIDVGDDSKDHQSWRAMASAQADRLSNAIDTIHGSESRRLDSILAAPSTSSLSSASVLFRNSLLSPLQQHKIVVMAPIVYAQDSQKVIPVPAGQAILALTKELAGLNINPKPDEDAFALSQRVTALQKVSVDRLIILDPLGGIPSLKSQALRGTHVFVNLEQEYEDITEELQTGIETASNQIEDFQHSNREYPVSPIGQSNPLSKFVEDELVSLHFQPETAATRVEEGIKQAVAGHLDNMKLLQQTLTLLPSSSSAIVINPSDAANSGKEPEIPSHQLSAVGTRRKRNLLIHNLLTDKPAYSSSLPVGRLGVSPKDLSGAARSPVAHSTFAKKGMPLTIFPDPRITAWTADNGGLPRLRLDDPRIELARLVHLIEDSFNRKLDVHHYMNRVNDRLAGLIIAGEYEGGAILTWETPPGVPDDGSPESLARMVPYLDKFAVLKRSQGAGGVADIVFNAMVRTCFPTGVCWRSRRNNPVNKWYFERSRGTWKLPGSNWAMFWTTDGVPDNEQTFWDYESVCRSIEPSWADKQKAAD